MARSSISRRNLHAYATGPITAMGNLLFRLGLGVAQKEGIVAKRPRLALRGIAVRTEEVTAFSEFAPAFDRFGKRGV